MENKTLKYDLGMLLVTVIWGYGFIATKYAADCIPAGQLIFYRFLLAAILMVLVFHKELAYVTKTDIINSAILGFFLAIAFFMQTEAINHTTIAKNAFLSTLNVIMVPVIYSIANRERIDNYSIAGSLLALTGTATLSFNMDFSINLGDILSILCAFFFSLQIFFQGRFIRKSRASVLSTGQICFGAFFSFFISLARGEMHFVMVEGKAVFGVVYLAAMSTCFCFFMQAFCQKFTSPMKTAVIFSLEAVFASIFAVIVFKDAVTPRFLLGSFLIFTAVIISSTKLLFLRQLFVDKPDKMV